MTFPKIYQGKFSCVNDVSMVIDISIATVYSEVDFDYFLCFSVFPLHLLEEENLLLLCAYFD